MYFRFLHCNNPILQFVPSIYIVSLQKKMTFQKQRQSIISKVGRISKCVLSSEQHKKFSYENKCIENISTIRELKFPQKYYIINLTNKYQLFKMKGFKSFSGRSILCRKDIKHNISGNSRQLVTIYIFLQFCIFTYKERRQK